MSTSCSEDDGSDTMWTRHLTLNASRLTIEEDYHAGIGGTLWEGAILMARWMSCPETFSIERFRGGRLIELGAGVAGIPGIVAAQLGCFSEVLITDIEECLERLHENVLSNSTGKYNVAAEIKAQLSQMHGVAAAPALQTLLGSSPPPAPPTSLLSNPSGLPTEDTATANAISSADSHACMKAQRAISLTDDTDSTVNELRHANIEGPALSSTSGELPRAAQLASEALAAGSGKDRQGAADQQQRSRHVSRALDADHSTAAALQQQPTAAAASEPCRTEVQVCELDWHRGCEHLEESSYDVVLVADVLYAEELVEPLLQCLVKLARPDSLVAIAIYNRSARVSAKFWQMLPQYFGSHKKVPEMQFNSPAQADDIGIFLLSIH